MEAAMQLQTRDALDLTDVRVVILSGMSLMAVSAASSVAPSSVP